MSAEETKRLVLQYFTGWQEQDWGQFRSALADDVDLEPFGDVSFEGADGFTEFCRQGTPWKDVTLLDSIFVDGKAALFYEGTDTKTEKRIRVGEFIDVAGGKIVKLRAAMVM